MRRTGLALLIPLFAIACSNTDETQADAKQAPADSSKAAKDKSAKAQKASNNEKPDLSAEIQDEALSIREAADKAAALVEADANQEIAAQTAAPAKPESSQ